MNEGYVGVIIPAAGSGSRMGGVYKPLEKILGKELLCYSLDVFEKCDEVGFVVISAREDKIDEVIALCNRNGFSKVKKVIAGGKDRQDSVENAFKCGLFDDRNVTHVAVHDAARPMLTKEMAEKAFFEAKEKGSAVCACRVRDTVKRSDDRNVVCDTVDREGLWLIQTPQIFEKQMYGKALESAKMCGFLATDDSSLVTANGVDVNLCDTPSYNIKITYKDDLYLAESILKNREEE